MKKWQVESISSIGGGAPRKLVFTGHDSIPGSAHLLNYPKKESLLVTRIRSLVGHLIRYL